jgi:radical SAM protein with 4Fe4S-binding SPASM domain
LGFDDIERILNKIIQKFDKNRVIINITGGEPLLYNDFFKLLILLENKQVIKRVNIITNGVLLNGERVELINRFKKIKEVKISLEGDSADTNDKIRGKGVFERVIFNINSVHKSLKKGIILMFTLGSYNYRRLTEMLRFASELRVDGVIIERFVPMGRGNLLKGEYLKENEWLTVIEDIIKFSNLDYSPNELLPYKAFHIVLKNPVEVRGALCNLGDESMALMPNGDVYPCRRFPTRIGNLLEDEFDEILLRLRILKENIIRNLKGKCKDCRIEKCWGCRAIAYAIYNDFYAEDPQCFYRKEELCI